VILAVDGGNSKTDVALLAEDGSVLAYVRGPLTSPHHLGLEGCVATLQSLIDQVALDGRADMAQIMLAGLDFPEEEDVARLAFEQRGWAARTRVGNDTFAVLRAGTERGWGIAVTCGAGMNCVGVSPGGRHVRFPALGVLTGDWGGGYDVGLAAIGAAARSEDGRGPATVLEQLVPAHFAVATPLEVARAIHEERLSRRRFVELAPIVMRAAPDDEAARLIVDRLVSEVCAFARAAAARLALAEAEVVLGGGLMRSASDALVAQIAAGLPPGLAVKRTGSHPIVGAALLALDELGTGREAQLRVREQLAGAVERYEQDDQAAAR
jgi:N-acetylglucosamine kinase-like BadF-type ATPase